jgi:hypothetical protein
VGGGVLEGKGVCVGALVGKGCVMEGVKMVNVGVSVAALDGILHASVAKTRASTNKKLRDFMRFSFNFVPSYLRSMLLTIDRLDSFSLKQIERHATHPLDFGLLTS